MEITKAKILSVWSNVFFIPPFLLAIENGDIPLAVLLGAVLLFSTTYHYIKRPGIDWWWVGGRSLGNSVFLFLDTLFAVGTFIYVVVTNIFQPFTPMVWFAVFICILGIFAYVFPNKKEIYEITHSTWHFLMGVALTLLGVSQYITNLV